MITNLNPIFILSPPPQNNSWNHAVSQPCNSNCSFYKFMMAKIGKKDGFFFKRRSVIIWATYRYTWYFCDRLHFLHTTNRNLGNPERAGNVRPFLSTARTLHGTTLEIKTNFGLLLIIKISINNQNSKILKLRWEKCSWLLNFYYQTITKKIKQWKNAV